VDSPGLAKGRLNRVPGLALSRRRNKMFDPPFFQEGSPPVGTFLGEDPVLERRIGLNRDVRNGFFP
jgi:hypothetical protein